MKDQILIVNELDGKIAEIIPETQPCGATRDVR